MSIREAARRFVEAVESRAYTPDGGDWDYCHETLRELYEDEEPGKKTSYSGAYFDVKCETKLVDDYIEVVSVDDPFEALKTALDEPEWISVEDRLPEKGVVVLVSDGENIYIGKGWTGMGGGPVTSLSGYSDNGQVCIFPLTHWRPIPDPPHTECTCSEINARHCPEHNEVK